MNHFIDNLYYGDNLNILRENIFSESVDLIYLDPPLNSINNYNLFNKSPSLENRWHWSTEVEIFLEKFKFRHYRLAELLNLMVRQIGNNDFSAYLVMMSVRLVELHRVLKPTGSLYLHCDPNASRYLKIILDLIFGVENFRNNFTWLKSTNLKNSQHQARKYTHNNDSILFYTKTDRAILNLDKVNKPLVQKQLEKNILKSIYLVDIILKQFFALLAWVRVLI